MPGLKPVDGPWIVVDEAYRPQMAARARLIAEARAAVLATTPGSEAAQAEALAEVLATLPDGFHRTNTGITTPDGRSVTPGDPLPTIGALLQEDVLLLDRRGDQHVLVAGLLCFPASWTLAEKIGRPLGRIHRPVDDYPQARVQRLFDRLPTGRAMWRANALGYADPALHQPRSEADPRDDHAPARYLRSERQTVLRLPRSGAILFAVHTYVVTPDALTPEQRATCPIRFAA